MYYDEVVALRQTVIGRRSIWRSTARRLNINALTLLRWNNEKRRKNDSMSQCQLDC